MAIRSKRKPQTVRSPATTTKPAPALFPIVGVGASAGGIDAFIELLRNIPDAPGLSFVYILHQEAKRTSSLPQVIARASKLPVTAIGDGQRLEIDHIYVAPPGKIVSIEDGVLRLHADVGSPALPIDYFFRSLADDQGSRAVGVILSGAASDGSIGLRRIKGEGGLTFVQDASAKFSSMPQSAVAAGAVDFILSPDRIAHELLRITERLMSVEAPEPLPHGDLTKLFSVLKATRDVDFTHYKPSTIERRIRRRMAIHRADTLQDYLKVIRENPQEIDDLYSDILIRVTGFFRDPDVFESLQQDIFPKMFERRGANDAVRVWVPGCATGEEVYSLAIALLESIASAGCNCPVQIFGTDISESAIDRARGGLYRESIAEEISPERLKRFFVRADGGYRISKAVRDICIFARQNVTKDPPFSKLDLISCRNVMIYLGPVLQRKVMSIFHYALRPTGYLLLGSSESIGAYSELFDLADRKHKIYRRKPGGRLGDVDFEADQERQHTMVQHPRDDDGSQVSSLFREADRIALNRFAPAGVLVNDQLDILQFRGRTSAFLEPAPGSASLNLLKMMRGGLLADVRAAIQAARRKNAPERREGIRVSANGSSIVVNVEVIPFVTSASERVQLVLFEEVAKPPRQRVEKKSKKDRSDLQNLKRELDATREYLQSIIEEQDAMNEELRSANEEIQSSNEELQSTNEELETAREELQSTNEELTTLNEELEKRNQELTRLNNDLMNLSSSIEMPVILLDGGLRIRRFNPAAQRTLDIAPKDIGRPIFDVKLPLARDQIERLLGEVMDHLETRSVDLKTEAGKRYSLRMRPYRTADNKIDGAVLVFVETHPQRTAA